MLVELFPEEEIFGYWGGTIIRCNVNSEMTGIFTLTKSDEASQNDSNPLVEDIDKFEIYLNEEGQPTFENGIGVYLFVHPENSINLSKVYFKMYFRDTKSIILSWSYNNFSKLVLDLLRTLEGIPYNEINPYFFGQVFDYIKKKKSDLPEDN